MTDDEAHDIAMDCAWSSEPTQDIKAALLKAVAEEREQCARLAEAATCDAEDCVCSNGIASQIRARA